MQLIESKQLSALIHASSATELSRLGCVISAHVFVDTAGMGIGMTVHNTLTHRDFRKDPHKAAKDVWEASG